MKDEIQKFLGVGDRMTAVEMKVDDIFEAPRITEELNTFFRASTTGSVQNSQGEGVDGVRVLATSSSSARMETVTNEAGIFALDLPSDVWSFSFEKDTQAFTSDPLAISSGGTVLRVALGEKPGLRRVSPVNSKRYYQARHWQEIYGDLFEALKMEKVVSGLILFASICLASLLILNTLIMVVLTKGKEIATLKALGCSRGGIQRIFIIEGTVIGIIGAVLGTGLGFGLCLFLKWYGYPLDSNVYLLNKLPVVLEPTNFVVVGLSAIAMCFVATLFPAYRAASLNPVDGLRYE